MNTFFHIDHEKGRWCASNVFLKGASFDGSESANSKLRECFSKFAYHYVRHHHTVYRGKLAQQIWVQFYQTLHWCVLSFNHIPLECLLRATTIGGQLLWMRLVIQSVYQVGSKSNCDLVAPERSPVRRNGRLLALLPAACAQAAGKLMLALDTQKS